MKRYRGLVVVLVPVVYAGSASIFPDVLFPFTEEQIVAVFDALVEVLTHTEE